MNARILLFGLMLLGTASLWGQWIPSGNYTRTQDGINAVGIGDAFDMGAAVPSQALHVDGNIRFSGALMPNNVHGAAGQVLTSAGANNPPTWIDINITFPSFPDSAGDNGGITNAFFGHEAGINNGDNTNDNTAIGFQTLYDNTAGYSNTAVGSQALFENTEGFANTASGNRALYFNTEGDYNTASGNEALYTNTTGLANTASGNRALRSNTEGDYNTAIGSQALYSNNTGTYNTASGGQALYHNTAGNDNTASGYQALSANTTGNANTANGHQTLSFNTIGNANTASGSQALYSNTEGNMNMAGGKRALYSNTKGNYNTANGSFALYYNVTGNFNTALGYNAGPLGYNAGPLFAKTGFNNTTALGYGATPTASNQVRIGNAGVIRIGGYASWSNLSDKRFKKGVQEDIPGLEFITKLRPVSYDLDREKIRDFLGKNHSEEIVTLATPPSYPRELGFIAQEVEVILTENGYTRIGIETPQNEGDHYSIRYAEFVVPLVKGMQEQQQMIEKQQVLIEKLQQEITIIKNPTYDTVGDLTTNGRRRSTKGFVLYQKPPTSFNSITTIAALVPRQIKNAKVIVYNLQGSELESYTIKNRGKITVRIRPGRFPAGMYLYALMADGQLIDTKKMILTK